MRLLIPLILVFSVSSCKTNSVQPVSRVEYGAGGEYDVYETVFKSMFDSSGVLVILNDSTATSFLGGWEDSARIGDIKENLPGLKDETLVAFTSENQSRVELMYISGVAHLVLSRDYDGTRTANEVSVAISRVGYDSSRTQAVVEVGEVWAPLAGSGTLFFLIMENGEWKVKGTFKTWIS